MSRFKKFNYRKLVLALADIFIIVIGGLIANYILSLFGYPGILAAENCCIQL